jgi:hypothetical protein
MENFKKFFPGSNKKFSECRGISLRMPQAIQDGARVAEHHNLRSPSHRIPLRIVDREKNAHQMV